MGIVVDHFFNGKHVIHSELKVPPTPETLQHAQTISLAIDKAFKEHGVTTLYTWAETPEQKRYNRFLGYSPTGETVNATFMDKDYPYPVEEYKKDLI